jgi:putative PIN family toxin of toxin-antitoxin system
MRVFLDTNVLASAAATRGLCADVLREVFARNELVICEQVLRELDRVLRSKFGLQEELIDDFICLLRQETILVAPGRKPNVKLRDKDDLGILAAALAGGATILITGDKELLGLTCIENLKILSPRQFWEELKTSKRPESRRNGRRPT